MEGNLFGITVHALGCMAAGGIKQQMDNATEKKETSYTKKNIYIYTHTYIYAYIYTHTEGVRGEACLSFLYTPPGKITCRFQPLKP